MRTDESERWLTTISSIGFLNATALVAAIGDVATFAHGRDPAAWLSLVPRQVTTGGRPRLLGITRRGSKYLRIMLISGARAAMLTLAQKRHAAADGYEACWHGRMPIPPSWRWQPKWRGPSGRCCATNASTIRRRPPPEPSLVGEAFVGLPMSASGERKMA